MLHNIFRRLPTSVAKCIGLRFERKRGATDQRLFGSSALQELLKIAFTIHSKKAPGATNTEGKSLKSHKHANEHETELSKGKVWAELE